MINSIIKYISCLSFLFLCACEDKIDLNLDDEAGKMVIVADLHNAESTQMISIHRTVAFEQNSTVNPVSGANVIVKNLTSGREFQFVEDGNGNYSYARMPLREGDTYFLSVTTSSGDKYEAQSTMPRYVEVDSIGLIQKTRFNDTYIYGVLTFLDPKGENNYYKYKLNVNNEGFVFSDVFNDKFNDGLYVDHELSNKDEDLKAGDSLRILRQCIDEAVYTYWSDFKSLNPGSAAPANPTSNISNAALGYFSVSSARYYELDIVDTGL